MQIVHGTIGFDIFNSQTYVALLHGGAGPVDPKGERAILAQKALQEIIQQIPQQHFSAFKLPQALQTIVNNSTIAAQTALKAICFLEENPLFNAGYGAALQIDGNARLSASFMESTQCKFSAVSNIPEVLHPSFLTCFLQQEKHCNLDSQGALTLARQLALPIDNVITLDRFEKWVKLKQEILAGKEIKTGTGTVGCVCIDAELNLAALTSTGGVGGEPVGRVGDTPTVAGNYCTKQVAISCTGYGEQIINSAFAARLATRVEDGVSLYEAMQKSFTEVEENGYQFAAIAVRVNKIKSEIEWACGQTTSYFMWEKTFN